MIRYNVVLPFPVATFLIRCKLAALALEVQVVADKNN
jgi:hypothetical protein